jgi:hypothetical protein
MNFFDRLIIIWRLPAWPALTLPDAVNLKRFLTPALVFILGILLSFSRQHPQACSLPDRL